MDRTGYLYIRDLFLVQAQRLHPELAQRPGWIDLHGRVLAHTPVLSNLGIRPGMPARRARRIAPEALVVDYRPEDYQQLQDLFCEIAYRRTPVVEPFRPGEIFLGLQEADCRDVARTLLAEIRDLGFQGVVAVAGSRLCARILGRTRPEGTPYLPDDERTVFLSPRAVDCLWTLPTRLRQRLSSLGLSRVSDVQRIPAQALIQRFGSDKGRALYAACRGVDGHPVQAIWPPETLCVEERFEAEMSNREDMLECLRKLSRRLSAELRESHRQCRRLRLEVTQEGRVLPESALTHCNPPASGTNRIYLAATRLFGQFSLVRPIVSARIVAEGLRTTPAVQLDLFTPLRAMGEQKEELKAYLALRFGTGTLKTAAEMGLSWREQMLADYR